MIFPFNLIVKLGDKIENRAILREYRQQTRGVILFDGKDFATISEAQARAEGLLIPPHKYRRMV